MSLVALTLREELTDAGYNVLMAANAIDAIQILKSRTESLSSLPTSNMPGSLDGLQLAALSATGGHLSIL